LSLCGDAALNSGDKTNKLLLFSAPTSILFYLPPTIAQSLSLQYSYFSSINDQHKRGPEVCVSTNRKLVCSIQFQPHLAFFNSGNIFDIGVWGRRIRKFSLTSRNPRIKNLSAPIQYQCSVGSWLQSLVSLLGKIIHQQYVTF